MLWVLLILRERSLVGRIAWSRKTFPAHLSAQSNSICFVRGRGYRCLPSPSRLNASYQWSYADLTYGGSVEFSFYSFGFLRVVWPLRKNLFLWKRASLFVFLLAFVFRRSETIVGRVTLMPFVDLGHAIATSQRISGCP